MAEVDQNGDNVISRDEFNEAITKLLRKVAGIEEQYSNKHFKPNKLFNLFESGNF